MNVLHDLAVWIGTSRGTLDLKTGILHSSPTLLDQEFRGERGNSPFRTSILGRRLLLVSRVQRGGACSGLKRERGSNLVICGALLHWVIAIKDQIGSYGQRQDKMKRLVPPPTHWKTDVGWCADTFKSYWKVKVKVAQLCLTHCNPMKYTVHRILQVRILEWEAFSFFRESSKPRDQT